MALRKGGSETQEGLPQAGAIPTIFPKTNTKSSSSCQTGRPASERRMQKAICKIFFSKKVEI